MANHDSSVKRPEYEKCALAAVIDGNRLDLRLFEEF